jgi:hypothetical protein
LQPEQPELAQTVKRHWLGHLRAQQGKVWECIGWDGQANKNPSYGTSIALPLGVLTRGELRADRLAAPLAITPKITGKRVFTANVELSRESQQKADPFDAGAKKDSKTK